MVERCPGADLGSSGRFLLRFVAQTGNGTESPLVSLMRSLAATLLLRLHSSAKSGGAFIHVLFGCATLLVSRFHFRLSCFHVAC